MQPLFDRLRAVVLGDEPYRGRGIRRITYRFCGEHGRPPIARVGRYLGGAVEATWGAPLSLDVQGLQWPAWRARRGVNVWPDCAMVRPVRVQVVP